MRFLLINRKIQSIKGDKLAFVNGITLDGGMLKGLLNMGSHRIIDVANYELVIPNNTAVREPIYTIHQFAKPSAFNTVFREYSGELDSGLFVTQYLLMGAKNTPSSQHIAVLATNQSQNIQQSDMESLYVIAANYAATYADFANDFGDKTVALVLDLSGTVSLIRQHREFEKLAEDMSQNIIDLEFSGNNMEKLKQIKGILNG